MALEAQIMIDLKSAMKAKDRIALEALRAIKTAILNEKTAVGATEITEAGELKLLTKLRKQRVESATIFREQVVYSNTEKGLLLLSSLLSHVLNRSSLTPRVLT